MSVDSILALKISLASHLQVFVRGRDLSVIFPGEYDS